VPLTVATVALITAHRRTRLRGEELSIAAAVGTGVILGLAAVQAATTVAFVIAGAART
jgi:hypothetical protein